MQKINILKRAIVDSLYIFVMGSIGLLFILEYTARDLWNEFCNQKGDTPTPKVKKPILRVVKRDG